MVWFYILTNILAYTSFSLLSRKWLRGTLKNRTFAFLYNIFSFIFSLIFYLIYYFLQHPSSIFFVKPEYSSNTLVIVVAALSAIVLWGYAKRHSFTAIAHIDVSVRIILSTVRNLLVILIGFLFYRDTFNIFKAAAMILILGANMLFAKKVKLSSLHKKGFRAFLLTTAASTIALAIEPFFLKKVNVLVYTLGVWGIGAAVLYAPQIKRVAIQYVLKKIGLLKIMSLAFLNSLSYYAYLTAITYANLSTVAIASAFIPALTVFGGIFLLKENKHVLYKIVSIFLATVGLVLLRMG